MAGETWAALHSKPMVENGFAHYRYRGDFGYIMINVSTNDEAIKWATKNMSGRPDAARIEHWDGVCYIPIQ